MGSKTLGGLEQGGGGGGGGVWIRIGCPPCARDKFCPTFFSIICPYVLGICLQYSLNCCAGNMWLTDSEAGVDMHEFTDLYYDHPPLPPPNNRKSAYPWAVGCRIILMYKWRNNHSQKPAIGIDVFWC